MPIEELKVEESLIEQAEKNQAKLDKARKAGYDAMVQALTEVKNHEDGAVGFCDVWIVSVRLYREPYCNGGNMGESFIVNAFDTPQKAFAWIDEDLKSRLRKAYPHECYHIEGAVKNGSWHEGVGEFGFIRRDGTLTFWPPTDPRDNYLPHLIDKP